MTLRPIGLPNSLRTPQRSREKRRRHPASERLFRPFVLSLGGMMETDSRDGRTSSLRRCFRSGRRHPRTHPHPSIPPGQHPTYHPTPTLLEIFAGNREALLGSLTPEQAKAVVEASSKLGRVWLTTIPFQPSLRLTDFEVAAALQLRTLTGQREAHCTKCGEANFFGHPEVCLQRSRGVWPDTEPSASSDRPLPQPPVPESDSNPLAI
jgi:hypothetical protein